ncbi:MAG TPA: phosphotransferase [Nocardioides sp.]|uniref:phosphotransferase enzyme family protein n=1 Tax=Nocardioides sp. TaxID=35761 RepID=UPI002E30F1A3|nr:phosphotransferase [Nocardioides sp.]HEX3931311.1 phosphotransferase [Nocardioides sp.]
MTERAALDRIAQAALASYDLPEGASAELVNRSENATYAVRGPDGQTVAALRVHRLDYHPEGAIRSELAWIDAVRSAGVVTTPEVRRARHGDRETTVADPDGATPPRSVVMFEWLPGEAPDESSMVDGFAELGELTARLHLHARDWQPPVGFTRFAWGYDEALGAVARWGRWQDAPGVDAATKPVLARLDATLRDRLAAYGRGPDRWGLIHADLRLANLLARPGSPTAVIDFDDCGFGWFGYDFGAAVSFVEDHPDVPAATEQWVEGYRRVASLSADDEAELATFVMFRRLLLLAWIGSHADVDVARELAPTYATGTADLAEDYLSSHT